MAELVLSSRTALAERELPLWARRALRGSLPAGTRVLNGSVLRQAIWGGVVLVNTTRGACLVSKNSFNRARVHFLPIAGEGPVQCPSCHTELMFAGRVRETFYCTSCGTSLRRTDRGVLPVQRGPPANRRYRSRQVLPGPPAEGPPYVPPAERAGTGAPLEQTGPIERSAGRRGTSTRRRRTRQAGTVRRRSRRGTTSPIRIRGPATDRYQPQCSALTPDGRQCRNSSRKGSRYCSAHRGYRPPALEAVVGSVDTAPRVSGAADTRPSYRRAVSHDGR